MTALDEARGIARRMRDGYSTDALLEAHATLGRSVEGDDTALFLDVGMELDRRRAPLRPHASRLRDLGTDFLFTARDPTDVIADEDRPGEFRMRDMERDPAPLLLACPDMIPPAAWREPGSWRVMRHQVDGFACAQVHALVRDLAWRPDIDAALLRSIVDCAGYDGSGPDPLMDASYRSIGASPEMSAIYRGHVTRLGATCEHPDNISGTCQAWYRMDASDANVAALSRETRSLRDLLGAEPDDIGAHLVVAGWNCD